MGEATTHKASANTWTIAFRSKGSRGRAAWFRRVDNWSGTWAEAVDMAKAFGNVNPNMEVWYVPSAESEAAGHVVEEDCGNVMQDNGKRTRMVEGGWINEDVMQAYAEDSDEAIRYAVAYYASPRESQWTKPGPSFRGLHAADEAGYLRNSVGTYVVTDAGRALLAASTVEHLGGQS